MLNILRNFQVLTEDEIEAIHRQSLKILAEIGCKVPHPEFLKLFQEAGANVKDEHVYIPGKLCAEALEYARNRVTTFNPRKEKGKLRACMSSEAFFIDYKTKEKRAGTTKDILKGLVIGNSLPNVDIVMPIVHPEDVANEIADIVSHQLCFLYSEKPFHAWTLSPETADYILRMAVVAEKPVTYIGEIISPLQISWETLEIALKYAALDFPVGFGSIVNAGSSGPVTLAGTLALQNAEYLLGLILVYLLKVSRPVTFAAGAHTMDLRTMACSFGSPNQALLAMAQTQLSKYYGLPATWNVGLSDANYPDFQSGFEKGMSAALAMAAGIDDIGLQGIVGADQGGSLEQLVIDNEWIDALNHVFRGMKIDEETLAFDVTHNVGIGGMFISESHTVEHMREVYWNSGLFNRDSWDSWIKKSGGDLLDAAAAKVEKILLEKYPPKMLVSQEVAGRLESIVNDASQKLIKGDK
ncbi:MAG: trimethylamine methyltransferase family protein [Bacillota bacterium]|jgi:trimethylamine--corrinoid protein Co-methyltransferase